MQRAKGQDSHYRANNYGGVTKPIIGTSSVRRNPHQFSLPNNEPVSRITTRINSNLIYHGILGLQYQHANLICSYGARSQLAGVDNFAIETPIHKAEYLFGAGHVRNLICRLCILIYSYVISIYF